MSVKDSVAIYTLYVLPYVYFIFLAHEDWLVHDEWLGNAASINKHLRPVWYVGILIKDTN